MRYIRSRDSESGLKKGGAISFAAEKRENWLELLSTGVLFLLFAALMLSVILFSEKGYSGISGSLEQTYGQRTVLSYVANQLRQHDQAHCVSLENRQGINALVLKEQVDETDYETLIYWRKGMVWEMFEEEGADIPLSSGTQVLPADFLTFQQDGEQISVKTGWKGKSGQLLYTLRSGTEDNETE